MEIEADEVPVVTLVEVDLIGDMEARARARVESDPELGLADAFIAELQAASPTRRAWCVMYLLEAWHEQQEEGDEPEQEFKRPSPALRGDGHGGCEVEDARPGSEASPFDDCRSSGTRPLAPPDSNAGP
jgi:hypothetical protein